MLAEPRTGPTSDPPEPYDPSLVAGHVRYGQVPGQLSQVAAGGKDVVYSYEYEEAAGDTTYRSPILHHVLLQGLASGQRYFYSVGGSHPNGTAAPESPELSFAMPPAPPAQLRVGVLGDPGQTRNTSAVLEQLADSRPDVVLVLGDLACERGLGVLLREGGIPAACRLAYTWSILRLNCHGMLQYPAAPDADLYYSNQTDDAWSFPKVPSSQQLRWDAWARLTEPLFSSIPAVFVPGNHEVCGASALFACRHHVPPYVVPLRLTSNAHFLQPASRWSALATPPLRHSTPATLSRTHR